MIEKYRGDTFIFPIGFEDDSNKYEIGDIVRIGIKKHYDISKYILFDEVTVEQEANEIQFIFTADQTKVIEPNDYIIEVELERAGVVTTCFQDTIKILGDIINDKVSN